MKTIFEKLVDKMITPTTILDSEREYLKKLIDDYYEGVRESKRLSTEFGCKSSNDKERKELLLTYVPDLEEFKGFSKHRLENEGVSYSLTKWASIYENANKKELDWVCQGFENEVDTNLNEIQNSIDCLAYLKRLEQKYSSSFKRENQIELSRILESSIRTLSLKDKNENEEQIRIDIDILNFVYEISIYVEVVVNRYINIYDKICSPPQNTESNVSQTEEKQPSTEKVVKVKSLNDKTLATRKKQPSAKTIIEFVNLINHRVHIYPQTNEYSNNDEKFRIISDRIQEKFGYNLKGSTLENNDKKQEGYSLEVYNLLTEWQYNTEATKYKANHNL